MTSESPEEFEKFNSYDRVEANKIRCSSCLEQKPISKMLNKGYRQVCKECDSE